MLKELTAGNLRVQIFATRDEMGEAAGAGVVACIKKLLSEKEKIN